MGIIAHPPGRLSKLDYSTQEECQSREGWRWKDLVESDSPEELTVPKSVGAEKGGVGKISFTHSLAVRNVSYGVCRLVVTE